MWAAHAMLVHHPDGYAQMGLLNAAGQWRSAIVFVPAIATQVSLPILANLFGSGNLVQYRQTLLWNLGVTAGLSTLVALPVALFASPIMSYYRLGPEAGVPILRLSAATAVLLATNGVVGTAILSTGAVWAGTAFNFLWAIAFLGGCHYLLPAELALGYAIALFGAYILHSAWQALYLRRKLSAGVNSVTPGMRGPDQRRGKEC